MKDFDKLIKEVKRIGDEVQKERAFTYIEMKNKVA